MLPVLAVVNASTDDIIERHSSKMEDEVRRKWQGKTLGCCCNSHTALISFSQMYLPAKQRILHLQHRKHYKWNVYFIETIGDTDQQYIFSWLTRADSLVQLGRNRLQIRTLLRKQTERRLYSENLDHRWDRTGPVVSPSHRHRSVSIALESSTLTGWTLQACNKSMPSF